MVMTREGVDLACVQLEDPLMDFQLLHGASYGIMGFKTKGFYPRSVPFLFTYYVIFIFVFYIYSTKKYNIWVKMKI